VFEILSDSNTEKKMQQKLEFYAEYGVEEYYIYDQILDFRFWILDW
jgi:Uma2 family endonuclease